MRCACIVYDGMVGLTQCTMCFFCVYYFGMVFACVKVYVMIIYGTKSIATFHNMSTWAEMCRASCSPPVTFNIYVAVRLCCDGTCLSLPRYTRR